jgi:hypothetical protein
MTTPNDTKRKDTGDETMTVAARGHGQCINTGNCGELGCPVPKVPRRGLVGRAVGAVRAALGRRPR